MQALRTPRGHYTAERASQLAGIPKTTVYDWQRNKIYQPDYFDSSPMGWSYRDLVYLRVLAWLRQQRMGRPQAAKCVIDLKARVATGQPVTVLRAGPRTFMIDQDVANNQGLQETLFTDMLKTFNVLDAVEEFGRSRLWGPDLVVPSAHTYISPWVMGGDPCVARTRIQSSSIFVLRTERGLANKDIVRLYPALRAELAEDAYLLEMRLRGLAEPIPA